MRETRLPTLHCLAALPRQSPLGRARVDLARASRGTGERTSASHARPDGVAIDSVLEDSKGRLWLTKGDKIGYVSAAAVASGQKVSCSFQALTGTRGLRKMVELPNGSFWVGTNDKGVWRYTDEEGWKPIPASLKQPSGRMGGFALSP